MFSMLPTLAELLILPAPEGAQVVSDQGQPITWLHVSEVLDAARFSPDPCYDTVCQGLLLPLAHSPLDQF